MVDKASGAVTIAAGTEAGNGDLAVDAAGGVVYAANPSGSIAVLSETAPGQFRKVESIPVERGTATITFDAATRRLFALEPVAFPRTGEDPKPGAGQGAGGSQLTILAP